jgi:ribonuclease E
VKEAVPEVEAEVVVEAEIVEEGTATPAEFGGPSFDDAGPTPAEIWESEISELSDPLFLDTPPETGGEAAAEVPPAESAPDREHGDRKSRSRRRRRGHRKGARPMEGDEPEQADEVSAELPSAPAEGDAWDAEGEDVAPAGDEAERAAEDRPRRRRRRRGGDRKRRPEPSASEAAAEPTAEPSVEPSAEAGPPDSDDEHDDHDLWDGSLGLEGESDEHEDGDESDDQTSHLSHRGIPTWEEAITLVVAKNLDARAKRPGNDPAHHRGGGRRGRDNKSRRPH